MKISAMILTLNNEDYIEYTLNSIKDIVDEIVICDGGSTDGTAEKLEQFWQTKEEQDKYTLFEDKTKDYAEMRNKCLEKITGDYVIVLDADEVFANSNGTLINRKQMESFLNQKFQFQRGDGKKTKAMKAESFNIFTRHFLWNYRTLDGRTGGAHFSGQRIFKLVKGVDQEYQRSIHEQLVWKKDNKTYFPKLAQIPPKRRISRTYPGFPIEEFEYDKIPTIWHFGHCRGVEKIRAKYKRSSTYADNPWKSEIDKAGTVDNYCAQHPIFNGDVPIIVWRGSLPEVMKLWKNLNSLEHVL